MLPPFASSTNVGRRQRKLIFGDIQSKVETIQDRVWEPLTLSQNLA